MAPFLSCYYKGYFSRLLLVKLQLQAEERGVVSIKGVCANRYLAMKEDGRLLASVSDLSVFVVCFFVSVYAVNVLVLVFITSLLRVLQVLHYFISILTLSNAEYVAVSQIQKLK